MNMAWLIGKSSSRPFLVALLLTLSALGILDLVQDDPEGRNVFHTLIEILFISLSLGSAALLWWGWRQANASLVRIRQALEARQTERDVWRSQAQGYLRGLGEAIDRQFRAWGLTNAECETAMLLLKGLGHKEIGQVANKSERTVRQHAIAVYRKSGLPGRAGLSAFFLEDLLLPQTDAAGADR
jgi:DNA-binding CsgD family transcriptional regulator